MRIAYRLLYLAFFPAALADCNQGSGQSPTPNGDPVVPPRFGEVRVKIQWDYKNVPLRIELYEPATERPVQLWDTGSVAAPQEAPVSIPIHNGEFIQRPGGNKTFVLTMKNPGTKPVHFFAAPHHVDPQEHSLGFHFNCLCVNHVFTVPPGHTWYRVVRLQMHKDFRGETLAIRHTLIGAGEEQMKVFGYGGASQPVHLSK